MVPEALDACRSVSEKDELRRLSYYLTSLSKVPYAAIKDPEGLLTAG